MPRPTNNDIAATLERYGKLLELSGESGFRVRAYGKAADAIRHHPGVVADLDGPRALQQIEGVGPGIAGLVDELVRTGSAGSIEALENEIPVSLLDVAAVPGVGTKTVSRLYRELGIVDLAGLEAAAQEGRIRQLSGFSDKTEAKIVMGIEALHRRTGRHRLGTLLPMGRAFVAELRHALGSGATVSLAGSVRRMEETVADLDIVVAASDLARTADAIGGLPSLATVGRAGDRLHVRLQSGIGVDITLAAPEQFGSTLVQATGTAAHLQLLGDIGEFSTEEALYSSLGLPFIPPEMREGGDELEIARSGALSEIVEIADIRGEFHCHTIWSDGSLSVVETVRAAERHGYAFLGISDHTRSLGVANGLDVGRLKAQRREIVEANRLTGIRVFASAEVEVSRDGRLDFDDATLSGLDVVIASTHVGLRQPREELTRRLVTVLENRNVDIIAHPSGRLLEQREGGDFDWEVVFATAARTGTALEINADPARLDLSAANARRALGAGCLLTINCDAHHPGGWSLLEFGIANARKAGARSEQILNCWPVERIEAWLKDRGR